MSCIVAIVMGFVFLLLTNMCASVLIWGLVISIICMELTLGAFLYVRYLELTG